LITELESKKCLKEVKIIMHSLLLLPHHKDK